MRKIEYYISPLDAADVSTHLRHSDADGLGHEMSHSYLVLDLLFIHLLDIREGLSNVIVDYYIGCWVTRSY